MQGQNARDDGDWIRAVYEEYDLGEARVGMISDPENEHAWIQSDVTVQITA